MLLRPVEPQYLWNHKIKWKSKHIHIVPYFAVSVGLCHIWPVLDRSSSHQELSNHCCRPLHQGRTSLRCVSCDCWCSSLPSYSGAVEHFYHPHDRYILCRNLAIPGSNRFVSGPARNKKIIIFQTQHIDLISRQYIKSVDILQFSWSVQSRQRRTAARIPLSELICNQQ